MHISPLVLATLIPFHYLTKRLPDTEHGPFKKHCCSQMHRYSIIELTTFKLGQTCPAISNGVLEAVHIDQWKSLEAQTPGADSRRNTGRCEYKRRLLVTRIKQTSKSLPISR
jgi:hypothetical protein